MPAQRLVVLTFLLNAALCVAHFGVWSASGSQLVLAQGADSLMDLAAGVVLFVSARVAERPRDEGHPFGHQRAEPIGALVAAVLAFVLAIEVGRSAIGSLIERDAVGADSAVMGVLAAKCAVKLAWFVVLVARSRGAADGGVVAATRVDTLNDVITTGSSLIGAFLVRRGHTALDALLALPVAALIARNGFVLARDSLRFLMGEAPPADVLARLRASVASIDGVRAVIRLRAHFVGLLLHVEATILIDSSSTAAQGHDIALDVQAALEQDPLVGEVFVHIDTGAGKDGT